MVLGLAVRLTESQARNDQTTHNQKYRVQRIMQGIAAARRHNRKAAINTGIPPDNRRDYINNQHNGKDGRGYHDS